MASVGPAPFCGDARRTAPHRTARSIPGLSAAWPAGQPRAPSPAWPGRTATHRRVGRGRDLGARGGPPEAGR